MRAWPVGLISLLSPLLCAGLWSWGTYHLAEKGYSRSLQRPSERDHQAVPSMFLTVSNICTVFGIDQDEPLNYYLLRLNADRTLYFSPSNVGSRCNVWALWSYSPSTILALAMKLSKIRTVHMYVLISPKHYIDDKFAPWRLKSRATLLVNSLFGLATNEINACLALCERKSQATGGFPPEKNRYFSYHTS